METSQDRTKRSGGHARSGPLLRTRDADAAPPQHRAPVATSREGRRARPGGGRPALLAVGAAGAAVVLAGGAAFLLGGDDDAPGTPTAAPRASASAGAGTASTAPGTASPGPLPSAEAQLTTALIDATAADRTAADARAALEEQLAARADANLALLESTWEGDEAAAAEAAQALVRSSAGLALVVTTWQDAATATVLRTGLDEQSVAARAYAAAVAAGDLAAADQARAQMAEVSRELGTELDRLTDGRIAAYVPPQDAAQYRAFVDALEAEDTQAAEDAADWLRARLTREGTALALALSAGGPS